MIRYRWILNIFANVAKHWVLFVTLFMINVVHGQEVSKNVQIAIDLSDKALENSDFTKALSILKRKRKELPSDAKFDALKVDLEIGKVYRLADKKELALNTFFELLTQEEIDKHYEEKVNALINIGYIYFDMQLEDNALNYFYQAQHLSQENNYKNGVAMSVNNIAAVLEIKKEYSKAKNYFLRALQLNTELNNMQWKGINCMNIGVIEKNLGSTEESNKWLYKALAIFEGLDDLSLKSRVLIKLAQNFSASGDLKAAERYALSVDSLASKHKFLDDLQAANELLMTLALGKGDTSQAFSYQAIAFDVAKEIDKKDDVEAALAMEQKYRIEKFELEQSYKEQVRRRNQLITIILLIVAAVASIFLVMRLRSKMKRLNQETKTIASELSDKQKQLVGKTLELVRRNQSINEYIDSIDNVIRLEDATQKDTLLKTLKKTIARESREDLISEFEFQFQAVHSQFYIELNKKYPDLTRNERRLCAFLFLNMSSKEISEITGQRPATIDVARTRLRKKLNLTQSGTSLSSFLLRERTSEDEVSILQQYLQQNK